MVQRVSNLISRAEKSYFFDNLAVRTFWNDLSEQTLKERFSLLTTIEDSIYKVAFKRELPSRTTSPITSSLKLLSSNFRLENIKFSWQSRHGVECAFYMGVKVFVVPLERKENHYRSTAIGMRGFNLSLIEFTEYKLKCFFCFH